MPCSDCSCSSVGDLQLSPLAKDAKDCDNAKKRKPTAAVKSNLMNKLHIAHNSSIADYSCHGADVEGRGIDKGWTERYEELVKFREVNGHCKVPSNCKLGQWLVKVSASCFLFSCHMSSVGTSYRIFFLSLCLS